MLDFMVSKTGIKTYAYYLPSSAEEDASESVHETTVNSVIIIGANGAGKSRLGAWIEQKHPQNLQRISALRNLSLSHDIQLYPFSVAINKMMYGSNTREKTHNSLYEWETAERKYRYTNSPVSNFDSTIAAIIARDNDDNRQLVRKMQSGNLSEFSDEIASTTEKRLQKLFSRVFPHRSISFKENTVFASGDISSGDDYNSCEMSDGERAGLYVMAQALCLPEGSTVIVDEPELHLHPAIITSLWQEIEKERVDCLFIFITHSMEFAEYHTDSDRIWVKSYDGKTWQYEIIPKDQEMPSALQLEVLGSRRSVLFVEGTRTSLDYRLYSLLFPEYLVVPCGSCQKVIEQTISFRNNSNLHHVEVYGLIDRDRRSQGQLEELRMRGINVLPVAEVENLFLLDEVMQVFAGHMGQSAEVVAYAQHFVVDEFIKEKERLEREACRDAIKDFLISLDVSGKSSDEIANMVRDGSAEIQKKICECFSAIGKKKDYVQILEILNDKSIVKRISSLFGLSKNSYCSQIILLLGSQNPISDNLKEAFLSSIPKFYVKSSAV